MNEQIEQSTLELSTFRFLNNQEVSAIPQRLQSLEDDVARQKSREKELQDEFSKLSYLLNDLQMKSASSLQ